MLLLLLLPVQLLLPFSATVEMVYEKAPIHRMMFRSMIVSGCVCVCCVVDDDDIDGELQAAAADVRRG